MHTPGSTPLNERSAGGRGRWSHDTLQMQKMNVCAFGGTRDPSNRMATALHLTLRGHLVLADKHYML